MTRQNPDGGSLKTENARVTLFCKEAPGRVCMVGSDLKQPDSRNTCGVRL